MNHIYNLRKETNHHLAPRHPRFCVEFLPPSADLRTKCPPVFDQGQIGSCTANAGVAQRMMLTGDSALLSRNFLYYMERKIDGDVSQDGGAQMVDAGTVFINTGCCPEADDPYNLTSFAAFKKKPTCKATKDAAQYKIKSQATLDDSGGDLVQQIKAYIVADSLPVRIGMDVYQSFESIGADGMMPMPAAGESVLGGHSVLIVGYDDTKQCFIVRNSWGTSWGDAGYFYMPYEYVEKKLAYDTWTISM